jgi:ketosteroid isomerase-like protein
MKKEVSTIVLSLFVMFSFAQTEKTNGTVYISHPYIDVVNNSVKAYATQDNNAWSACYADSANFWISGMDMSKWNTKKQNLEMLNLDFKFFKDVTVKPFGYPDYIAYDQGNDKVVQSWWTWTGTSKKTGKKLVITYVIFDWFNIDGKIVKEGIFGDFSKQFKEEGINL